MYAGQAAQVYLESTLEQQAASGIIEHAATAYLATAAEGCHVCGISGDANQLLVCSRCHQAWYCGRACQKAAWKRHKVDCAMHSTIASLRESRASFTATCLNMLRLYLDVVTDAPAFVDWDVSTAQDLVAAWSNTSKPV